MSIEIRVPTLPESVADASIAKVYKKEGDTIRRDENLLDLETDKVMIEVPSLKGGIIEKLNIKEGDTVVTDQLLAVIREIEESGEVVKKSSEPSEPTDEKPSALSPSVRRLVKEHDVDLSKVKATGKEGRITKQDVESYLSNKAVATLPTESVVSTPVAHHPEGGRLEERVPMSRLRARVAERLISAQQEAALLTTFNEINMKPIMDLRARYKESFERKHGVRLGFMSFFVKAAVEALRRFPAVNAYIDGNDILYHNYQDIGVAIGSERGLVVPILRDAQDLSMADVESRIRDFAMRAGEGKLSLEEMMGGTFTITNGGTFGSMLSTPIINPPQSAILGMHNIVDRPVVEAGEIVVRPIMYVALSYDHRLIDGSISVRFLVTIKELLEDPARFLLVV